MAPLNYFRSTPRVNIESDSAVSVSVSATTTSTQAQQEVQYQRPYIDQSQINDNPKRQLTLDVSTPTRTSATDANTTRRTANPTLNDLSPEHTTTRATAAATAPSIRTTRSDNPTIVGNLEISSSSNTKTANDGEATSTEGDADEGVPSPTSTLFTRTTTIHSSSSSSGKSASSSSISKSGTNSSKESESQSSILSSAVATTNLSWWQLLALIICGILALSVGSWLFFRHQQRRRNEKQQKKKEEMENEIKRKKEMKDDQRFKALAFGHNSRRGRGRGRYDSDDYEDYWTDEYSDGGTIRPSRRRRRRRDPPRRYRRDDKRRRRDEYSDEDDDDDETYSRSIEPKSAFSFRPSPSTPSGTGRGLKSALTKKKGFRDSVFSTYTSMKKAAIKHKYVEAKIKLDEQLKQEEELENQRKIKVLQANREIEEYNKAEMQRKATLELAGETSGNRAGIGAHNDIPRPSEVHQHQPQWGYGNRTRNDNDWNGSGNVNGINGNDQKWPSRNGEPSRGKLLIPPVPRQPSKTHSTHEIPTAALLPYQTSPKRERSHSLDGEISNLLGNSSSPSSTSSSQRPEPSRQATSRYDKRKGVLKDLTTENAIARPRPTYQPSTSSTTSSGFSSLRDDRERPIAKKGYSNPFQIDWLNKSSSTTVSLPTEVEDAPSISPRYQPREDVSVGMRHPNERPVLPRQRRGVDATAGPVSLRGKGSVGFGLGEGNISTNTNERGDGKKWASRLRERR
ncbi:hypothetical protein V865_001520 [Kwoniella europaea PYCC6329]|uniref:Uncharacterized protein n=1 Tax=Kwoniella europaea PYCC6329 TaxID=1423913 RepID=A0AAX4KCC7_9TREE